jgi:DNA-binding NtrC family response regulator
LYYRLNVVPIALPPLRDRHIDILPLAEHFLLLSAPPGARKHLTTAAARLLEHSWPGNVRELRNVIDRAHVLVRGDAIDASDLDMRGHDSQVLSREDLLVGDMPTAVARLETAMIRNALEACGWQPR